MNHSSFSDRTRQLIGSQAYQRLRSKKVLLVGLGGVGSYALEALARMGIGTIIIVDGDKIEESNLNRQLLALISTVGRAKTSVALERVGEINPECQVIPHNLWLSEENVDDLLESKPDFIIDAIDQVDAKGVLIEAAVKKNIEIVSVLGTGKRMSSEGFVLTKLSKTEYCPLARAVRRRVRQLEVKKDIDIIYSPLPLYSSPDQDSSKEQKNSIGSNSFVPAIAGLMAAERAINYLLAQN